MANLMLRAVIAITALALAAFKLFRPEIKVDMTLLAFIVIAGLAIFGPKFRIKGLDLLGFKVEFPEPKPETAAQVPVVPPVMGQPANAVLKVEPDTYLERFVKLTPTEVIGAYAVMMAMVQSPSNGFHSPVLPWAVFALFLVMTPFYFQRVVRVPLLQSLLSVIEFAAWALILPGPFAALLHYDPIYGALAFIGVTAFLPMVVIGERG